MRSSILWVSHNGPSRASLTDLAERALTVGGRRALAQPGRKGGGSVAHVHGEQHDLWWEFGLEASFRWQAHLHRIRPEIYQQRLHRLTRALGLDGLLSREVSSLTHSSRALADLAVALLPQPSLLLWEEPFYLMAEAEAARAVRLVRELHAEGMALVAIAAEPPGLFDLEAAALWRAPALLHLAR